MTFQKLLSIILLTFFSTFILHGEYFVQKPNAIRKIEKEIVIKKLKSKDVYYLPKGYYLGQNNDGSNVIQLIHNDKIFEIINSKEFQRLSDKIHVVVSDITGMSYVNIQFKESFIDVKDSNGNPYSRAKLTIIDDNQLPFKVRIDINYGEELEKILNKFLGKDKYKREGDLITSDYFDDINIYKIKGNLYQQIDFEKTISNIGIFGPDKRYIDIHNKLIKHDNGFWLLPNVKFELTSDQTIYSVYQVPKDYRKKVLKITNNEKLIAKKTKDEDFIKIPYNDIYKLDNFYKCEIDGKDVYSIVFNGDNTVSIEKIDLIVFDLNSTDKVNYKGSRDFLTMVNEINRVTNNTRFMTTKLYYLFPERNCFDLFNISKIYVNDHGATYKIVNKENQSKFLEFRRSTQRSAISISDIPRQFFSCEKIKHIQIDEGLPNTKVVESSFSMDYLDGIKNVIQTLKNEEKLVFNKIHYISYNEIDSGFQKFINNDLKILKTEVVFYNVRNGKNAKISNVLMIQKK